MALIRFMYAFFLTLLPVLSSAQQLDQCDSGDEACLAQNHAKACRNPDTSGCSECQQWLQTLNEYPSSRSVEMELILATTYYDLGTLTPDNRLREDYHARAHELLTHIIEEDPEEISALYGLNLLSEDATEIDRSLP